MWWLFGAEFPSVAAFFCYSLLAVIAALALDRCFAEPARFHPLVGFGYLADLCQRRLNPLASQAFAPDPVLLASAWRLRLRGVLALSLLISPLFLLVAGLAQWLAAQGLLWLWILDVLLLYSCIGGRSLQQHVSAVEQALAENDLALARQRLSWIVSRDCSQLDAGQVAQAATETLLENSCDAVFASLFWFVLGGGLVALLHRWVNTLDAMWGYKTPQLLHFGWAAARLDDLLNYIPARLTALSFCYFSTKQQGVNLARQCWREQAHKCASPNGGVVMCAGAGALACRLSEGAWYHGQWQVKPVMGCGQAANQYTLAAADRLVQRTVKLWLLVLVTVTVLGLMLGLIKSWLVY